MHTSKARMKALEKALKPSRPALIPVFLIDGADDDEERKQKAWQEFLSEGGDPDSDVTFLMITRWGPK